MEHKSGGTPNPLNPNMKSFGLDANPSDSLRPVHTPRHDGFSSHDVHHGRYNTPNSARPASLDTAQSSMQGHHNPPHSVRPIDMIKPIRPIDMVKPSPNKHPSTHPSAHMAAPEPIPHNAAPSDVSPNNYAPHQAPHAPTIDTPSNYPSNPSMHPTPQPYSQFSTPAPAPSPAPQQAYAPAASLGVVTNTNGINNTPAQANPMNRPMQQAAKEEKKPNKKRKRTGLIIGAIVCLFLAIGCGVAAALLFLNNNKTDPVATAMNRLVAGESPNNISLEGTIDIKMNDQSSPFSNYKIKINADADTKSLINSTSAIINANQRNGSSVSAEFKELYAPDGALYIRLNGVIDLLQKSASPLTTTATEPSTTLSETVSEEDTLIAENPEAVDCYIEDGCPSSPNVPSDDPSQSTIMADPTNDYSALLAGALSSLQTIEGKWLKIPTSDLSSVTSTNSDSANQLSCLTQYLADYPTSSSTISQAYQQFPFIASTNQNINVDNVKYPIHQVLFNDQNLSAFIDQTKDTTAIKNLTSCLGLDNSNKLITEIQNLSPIYVEVDEDYDITRIYTQIDLSRNCDCPSGAQCIQACDDNDSYATATIDLRINYPTNISVAAPSEYQDFSAVLQSIIPVDTINQDGVSPEQNTPPTE